jgi:hypothetical protein
MGFVEADWHQYGHHRAMLIDSETRTNMVRA